MERVMGQGAVACGSQRGGAAVEFAFVLPLLIMLSYSTIVYGYVFVIYESLNFAAHQSAEAAIAVQPGDDYAALVQQRSQLTAAAALSWLPTNTRNVVVGTAGSAVEVNFCQLDDGGALLCTGVPAEDANAVQVVIDLDLSTHPVLPVLTLPGIGSVPPLPSSISGRGVVLIAG